MKRKKVIDLETLEVYESVSEAARKLNCRKPWITQSILLGYKARGRRLEYLDEWLLMTSKEKESYTRKNNIYFY